MQDKKINETKILVIAGPSGSGKNSIMQGVLERCDNCARLVTATTRSMRDDEVDGVDYHFITKDKFLQGIKGGSIPEFWHAQDTDRYYGTYLPDLEQKTVEGKVVVAQVQAEGIKYFKEHFNTLAVIVVAGSEEELIGRVVARNPVTEEELKERMDLVQKEMVEFNQVSDYTVRNENGRLEQAIEEVITILKKENYVR